MFEAVIMAASFHNVSGVGCAFLHPPAAALDVTTQAHKANSVTSAATRSDKQAQHRAARFGHKDGAKVLNCGQSGVLAPRESQDAATENWLSLAPET